MKQQSDDETELRRYLLGELTEEERAGVEERFFLDSDYFRQLQAAEDDLMDDYVYEELPAADRGRFETYFLSQPGHRQDLKIAQALRMYISAEARLSQPGPTFSTGDLDERPAAAKVAFFPRSRRFNSLARLSLAAAAVIILAFGIWLILRAVRNRDQSPPIQVQRPEPRETAPATPPQEERTTNSQPATSPVEEQERRAERKGQEPGEKHVENREGREVPRPRESPPQDGVPGGTLAVLLIPGGGVRGGGETNKVALTSGVRFVNLQLPLVEGNGYRNYQVSLQADGRTILTRSGLKSVAAEQVNMVPVTVPAKLLRHGNYQIKLSGVTAKGETHDIAAYAFQVELR